jgi:phage terminase Nu1 subunit (DNA packaging protein)
MTVNQLAKLIDVSPRYIQQLTKDGILHRATDEDGNELRGRYNLLSVRDYCRYLRTTLKLDDASEQRYSALRNERMAAENELSQLNLEERKGQLHNSDDVEFVMTQMLTAFKSRVLAIPSRVARQCVGKKFREIFDIIMYEIEQCLLELSGYDESKFAKENREYLASKGIDLSALDEPPAAA